MTAAPAFPNFFIVGAPRCGTTSLSKYLRRHPQVGFSGPKETHFFTAIHPNYPDLDIERDYVRRFFFEPKPEQRIAGEGSVAYLYSPEAIAQIQALNPDARFIIMARNPMEMLPSFHAKMILMLNEDVDDFGLAWALQEIRQRGERIPEYCVDPRLLQYSWIASIGSHAERLIATAGAENTLVILHDDLVSDTRGVYKRTLDFLGVDDDGREIFPRFKQGERVRSRLIHKLLYPTPLKAGGLKEFLEKRGGDSKRVKPRRRKLAKRLVALNYAVAKRPAMDSDLRHRLQAVFAPDIALLGRIVSRDLSHWT